MTSSAAGASQSLPPHDQREGIEPRAAATDDHDPHGWRAPSGLAAKRHARPCLAVGNADARGRAVDAVPIRRAGIHRFEGLVRETEAKTVQPHTAREELLSAPSPAAPQPPEIKNQAQELETIAGSEISACSRMRTAALRSATFRPADRSAALWVLSAQAHTGSRRLHAV